MREKIMGFIGGVVIASLLALCIQPAIASVEDNLEKTSVETRVKAAEANTGVATAKSNATTANSLLTKWDNLKSTTGSYYDSAEPAFTAMNWRKMRKGLAVRQAYGDQIAGIWASCLADTVFGVYYTNGEELQNGWRVTAAGRNAVYIWNPNWHSTNKVTFNNFATANFSKTFTSEYGIPVEYKVKGPYCEAEFPNQTTDYFNTVANAKAGYEYWIYKFDTDSSGNRIYYYIDANGNKCSTTDTTKTCYMTWCYEFINPN